MELAINKAFLGVGIEESAKNLNLHTDIVAHEKMMSLDTLVPNETTLAAIDEARNRHNLPRVSSIKELFEELNADE